MDFQVALNFGDKAPFNSQRFSNTISDPISPSMKDVTTMKKMITHVRRHPVSQWYYTKFLELMWNKHVGSACMENVPMIRTEHFFLPKTSHFSTRTVKCFGIKNWNYKSWYLKCRIRIYTKLLHKMLRLAEWRRMTRYSWTWGHSHFRKFGKKLFFSSLMCKLLQKKSTNTLFDAQNLSNSV